ncbi:hypothetical protein JQ641_30230 [Bradyrhizobium sp. JYMT SZCCT0180]|nr:hypothetical protein [Bradyrhizobium sp. JYMT SZCCT0180]
MGIVLIFSIAGPLTLAALISLIVVGFGAALLQMFLALLELEALRTIVSVAIVLLALATMLAAFLPAVAAGLIFALAAVYGGINMIWMAWLAAAIAVAGFVVFGIFLVPSESSAVILPDVRSARQALTLSAVLAVLAIVPTSLCWWLAKPLHRARTTA